MGRLILIEGLDLAGKSTLVAHLQRCLESRGYAVEVARNCLCPDNPIAHVADQVRRDPERTAVEGGCLFLAAHHWDLRHFHPPGPGQVRLQDSCWLRALAYEEAFGRPDLLRLWKDAPGPSFDQILFLTASLEQRRARFSTRSGNDAGDAMVFTDPEGFQALEQSLRRQCLRRGGVVLDTTGLTPGQVLNRALLRLANHRERLPKVLSA